MTDAQTIHSIIAGDIDQYRHIVDAYHGRIHSFLRAKLFDKTQADDLAQIVFIKFYKHIHRFDANQPVLPYLFAIANTELKMLYRSYKKGRVSLETIHEQIAAQPVSEVDADEIERSLSHLTDDQRKALLLFAEGYSYQEISLHLDRPINTIRTLIRRARLAIYHT